MEGLYASIKGVHMTSVAASFALFGIRGAWLWLSPGMLRRRWVRIVPHVVDTVLLASGLALAALLGASGSHAWLGAKVAGLVVYIVLGSIALRYGRTPGVRSTAFVGALATFAWIVSVAITKSPAGFFTLL
ncbi:MAG: SirB2 family protein [Betaproteobacteria bacterium]|nr:SirB2 family protein [Betaproteobacteria bacterium]